MLRGEIYSINIGKGRGRELSGVHFFVIVTDDFTNSLSWLVSAIPGIDARQKKNGIFVSAAESGLPIDLRFLPNYIRSFDFQRFAKKKALGIVPLAKMEAISIKLKGILEIK